MYENLIQDLELLERNLDTCQVTAGLKVGGVLTQTSDRDFSNKIDFV